MSDLSREDVEDFASGKDDCWQEDGERLAQALLLAWDALEEAKRILCSKRDFADEIDEDDMVDLIALMKSALPQPPKETPPTPDNYNCPGCQLDRKYCNCPDAN